MREDVLQRKLIADGEGTAEEKRYHVLLGHIRSLIEKPCPEEASKALRQIEVVEFSLRKQNLIAECCALQKQEYSELIDNIEKEILASKDKMADAKKELNAARLVRRNRQEYAQIVKQIEELPSRDESARKLEEIQEELTQQHERQRLLESKLNERRVQLQAFNGILATFQQFLDNDEGLSTSEHDEEEKDSKKDENMETEIAE
ncbi:unnamed protein product [Auanema sp. JU1783]|nr:unnamed protein product [Auanema sp. JU1783]